jgi:two-component system cell cycle response regulator
MLCGGGVPVALLPLAAEVTKVVRQVPAPLWFALGALAAFAVVAGAAAFYLAFHARRTDAAAATLRQRAMTDQLTGALNRRGFEERLAAELARARRTNRPLAIAYLDVVGLKAVNDTYGHHAGDRLLQSTGRLLRENSREEDAVARIGGDEWAVILPEQDRRGAKVFARRLLGRLPFTQRGLALSVPWSLTVGWAVYPEDGDTPEALLAAADRRLYARRGIELGR